MLWAHIKTIVVLTIPLCTVAYAHQLRFDADCDRIQCIVKQPTDIQWSLAHRREVLERGRTEAQSLDRLLEDLGR
jgi:hypothetical protein